MIIRQYKAEDVPQLIRMRFDFTAESKDIAPELYEPFHIECTEFFNEIKETDRWNIWIAEVEGVIVSHIFVEIIDTVPRPGRKKSPYGYVTNVYTVPEYRSKGIGGKIMEENNSWAKEYGLSFLVVWPSETSVEFYKKHGFEQEKEVMKNHLRTI